MAGAGAPACLAVDGSIWIEADHWGEVAQPEHLGEQIAAANCRPGRSQLTPTRGLTGQAAGVAMSIKSSTAHSPA